MKAVYLLLLALPACAGLAPTSHRTPLGDAWAAMQPDLLCSREEPRGGLRPPMAVDLSSDPPCVVYDDERQRATVERYGYGVAVGIFAHELGHLKGLREGDLSEAYADWYAGCVLAREGFGPDRYVEFLDDHGEAFPARVQATQGGWASCRDEVGRPAARE